MSNLDYYLNLIPAQHRQRPKYTATLTALLQPLQDTTALLTNLRTAFDLDTAIGVQLDAVGVRVGRSRQLYAPLDDVYFSWNVDGLGWGEGLWRGKHDPIQGVVSLPDDLYRLLLRAKVAANQWDGTTGGAYAAWREVFAEIGSTILIQDNQDMSIIIGIAGLALDRVFEQLLLQGYLPLKPEGVRVAWYSITHDGGPLFAWNTQSETMNGWNIGSWPNRLIPTITTGG